ncbi:hypothetical protein ACJRO7_002854 [Eucalyptus globulus]|uniref:Exostosin GT47 domain-containing protein n=1 Tax=Eucalyptus globulus TaxID=34317 RepID=A0ABD3LVS9_EUCGL
MLPISDQPPPEPHKKKTASDPLLVRKNSFNSLASALQPYLSLRNPRTCLFLAIVSLQILILLVARSVPLPPSFRHARRHFPAPITAAARLPSSSSSAAAAASPTDPPSADHDQCGSGKIYVYEVPSFFNAEILKQCDNLNPWSSRCDALANNGFGQPTAGRLAGIVPEKLAPAWFWTDQFVSEILFHNRMLKHPCRTTEPGSAAAFYIPFYAGLAVGKYLWSNSSAKERDRHCEMMLRWVQDQAPYKRSNGWDHFITMGRITWDFRRSKDQDWGSSCIYTPGMRNITRLVIERNSWDYFDVGVPYPTGFHPRSDADVAEWQDFVRARPRPALFCFAGAKRGAIRNDFRGILLSQCRAEPDACRAVDCGGSRCANGTSEILETFLGSKFCLQPRGDSFTRRSIFDCMVAGSIPVFFWKRTAYYQYEWFLPAEPGSYSVFIDRKAVENGTSIRKVLERYSEEEVRRMREKVIEYIPKFLYAMPEDGLESVKDAFDVAIDGVLRRFKEQEEWGFKWK